LLREEIFGVGNKTFEANWSKRQHVEQENDGCLKINYALANH